MSFVFASLRYCFTQTQETILFKNYMVNIRKLMLLDYF